MPDDEPNGLNLRSLHYRLKKLEDERGAVLRWLAGISIVVVSAIVIAVLRGAL